MAKEDERSQGEEYRQANFFQRTWRRGRERFIDPALIGAGVAGVAVVAGLGIHFFVSSAIGITPEALSQTYVSMITPIWQTVVAGAGIGGVVGILRGRRNSKPAMFGGCLGL